jgi:hypothetical protein
MTPPSDEIDDAVGEAPPRCSFLNCQVPPALLRHDALTDTWWCRSHDPAPSIVAQRLTEAARGGDALARKIRKGSGLDLDELGGPLLTPQDAKRWAEVITRATVTGQLTPSAANAALKGVADWLKAHDQEVRQGLPADLAEAVRLKDLRIAELEGEIKRLRTMRRVG